MTIKINFQKFGIPLNCETIYLAIYVLYIFIDIWDKTTIYMGKVIKLFVLLFAPVLFALFMIQKKLTVKKMLISASVFAIFFIASFVTNRFYLLLFGMFIITSSITKFQKIAVVSLVSSLVGVLTVVMSSVVGILSDYTFIHEGRVAHCIGFAYYSTAPYILMYNMLVYMYLRKNKTTWLEVACFFILNFVMYQISTLRLAFYLSLVAILMFIVLIKFDWFNLTKKPIVYLSSIIYGLLFIATIICAQNYNRASRGWRELDDILNGRLYFANTALGMYDIKLFGNYISMLGNIGGQKAGANYFYIDSGYVYSLLGYGVIFSFIVVLAYSVLYVRACRKNDKLFFIWLSVIAFFSVINNTWINITYNPALLYLFIKESKSLDISEWFRKKPRKLKVRLKI